MYVVLGAAGLFKAQQMIVGSQEKKKAAQKLKELNLRTQDIIAIVISGLVLLVMFAAFILLAAVFAEVAVETEEAAPASFLQAGPAQAAKPFWDPLFFGMMGWWMWPWMWMMFPWFW